MDVNENLTSKFAEVIEDVVMEVEGKAVDAEEEKHPQKVTNDSGLETGDSMDIAKEEGVFSTLVPLCPENVNDMPKTVTFTNGEAITSTEIKEKGAFSSVNSENIEEKLPNNLSATEENLLESPNKSCASSRRSSVSTSFLDSLIDKFNRRKTIDGESRSSSPQKVAPPKELKECNEEDLLDEIDAPIAFEKPSHPNMLPTPIVKHRAASAFVNSDEEFEKTIAKHQLKMTKAASMTYDKYKMSSKSLPPKMGAPNYPVCIPKPRTLAEKRMLVNTNVDFLMIEQEAKIFKQIQRKSKNEPLNYNLIDSMMFEDVPINCDPWKALQWLRTQEDNYIQQHIFIDGVKYKLCGSRGNHTEKFLPPQSNKPYPKIQKTSMRSLRCCAGGKIKKNVIDRLVTVESIRRFVLEESLEPFKRLETKNLQNQLISIKPRPLGKKIEFLNQNKKLLAASEDSTYLGEFSKFKMPDIKLSVNVQHKVPINHIAKQYLYDLLPYQDLNEDWINFALSPLKSEEDKKKNFEFTVPYQNSKRHVLVREIIKAKSVTESLRIFDPSDDDVDEMEWTFAANADKDDKLEMEIVDMIKDLTNSVFINLNDDLFTKEDPDDRTVPICPLSTSKELSKPKTTVANKKILSELRRLNANVFKSEATDIVDDEIMRKQATAHLGREERDLRPTVIVTESDTLLLTKKDKESRRTKRLPKKFSDFLHTNSAEGEDDEPPIKKTKSETYIPPRVPTKTKTPPPDAFSHDDMKAIKQEVQKWLHVNVELNRMEVLSQIQPWCMLHQTYKCGCKNIVLSENKSQAKKIGSSRNSSRCASLENEELKVVKAVPKEDCLKVVKYVSKKEEVDEEGEETSRRVLPVELKRRKLEKPDLTQPTESHESPKMEIVNLSDLVNNKRGPIFINIYDTKENRLNSIFHTILTTKCALAYVDGYACFIDTTRADVSKMKFEKLFSLYQNAIFVLQPKTNYLSRDITESKKHMEQLFKNNTGFIKGISNRHQLKEVSKIVATLLRSAKRKIENQIDGEPSAKVKEQLNRIHNEPEESENSTSSSDSAYTSPLHFNEIPLEIAPSPGRDSVLMDEFNRIFSIRMQRLCSMVKSNTLGLHPLDAYINKFYIYRWSLLLQSFETEMIHIWQASIVGESGDRYQILALTDVNEPPTIEDVAPENVANIRKLSLISKNITQLTRLILMRAENEKTRFMTVLLYGCKGYFRICGILNNKENFVDGFVAKPNRVTHPRLTAKIQKIYNFWYELKMTRKNAEREKEAKNEEAKSEIKMKPAEVSQKVVTCEKSQDDEQMFEPIKEKSNGDVILIEDEEEESDKEDQMESKENKPEQPEIMQKLVAVETKTPSKTKWFLFNVASDFTDIFIKEWQYYLGYDKVMKAIELSQIKQKTLMFKNDNRPWPQIYAIPKAPLKFKDHSNMTDNFLIVGPYPRNSNSNLLLMQNYKGDMYLRDDYEKMFNITRAQRTRCIWIYADKLKCIQEFNKKKIFFDGWNEKEKVESKKIESENKLIISTVVGGFQE